MSSDPIPLHTFPVYIDHLKSMGVNDAELVAPAFAKAEVIRRATSSAAADAGVALDPVKFETEVLKAASQKGAFGTGQQTPPEIRHQLLAFVSRHAPGTSVIRGETDGFDWRTGVLTLARETARGEGMRALLTVAHECGHANQRRDWPWLPWWALKVPVIRLWLECNCWHRARMMLT